MFGNKNENMQPSSIENNSELSKRVEEKLANSPKEVKESVAGSIYLKLGIGTLVAAGLFKLASLAAGDKPMEYAHSSKFDKVTDDSVRTAKMNEVLSQNQKVGEDLSKQVKEKDAEYKNVNTNEKVGE